MVGYHLTESICCAIRACVRVCIYRAGHHRVSLWGTGQVIEKFFLTYSGTMVQLRHRLSGLGRVTKGSDHAAFVPHTLWLW